MLNLTILTFVVKLSLMKKNMFLILSVLKTSKLRIDYTMIIFNDTLFIFKNIDYLPLK